MPSPARPEFSMRLHACIYASKHRKLRESALCTSPMTLVFEGSSYVSGGHAKLWAPQIPKWSITPQVPRYIARISFAPA